MMVKLSINDWLYITVRLLVFDAVKCMITIIILYHINRTNIYIVKIHLYVIRNIITQGPDLLYPASNKAIYF